MRIYNYKQKTLTIDSGSFWRQNYLLSGFTLIETVISLTIFILLVTMVSSLYALGSKSYQAGGSDYELWQNARVVLDRLTRELRQAEEIVTTLPPGADDPLNPPATELFFKDGHNASVITYLRYYQNGAGEETCLNLTDVCRQVIAYYFDIEPNIYVRWDSVDSFGNSPQSIILEDRLVGEFFSNLSFWGDNTLINIAVVLENKGQRVELLTAVFGRNL